MNSCASEVSRFCAGVDQGKGRVTACLASQVDKLGAGCRPDVEAAAGSRLVPNSLQKIFDPAFRAELPLACEAAAARFCPGLPPGSGRVFACLYAHTNQIGGSCSTEAQALLNQN